ncbi:hypothetical protein CF328_g2873 [Tilletia controversa]|nr:hypothetical protein CF335_g8250 [Tilletia laevis]KAE8200766.1 hypothetical protein CF328_g2873 [Tilletia controversa]
MDRPSATTTCTPPSRLGPRFSSVLPSVDTDPPSCHRHRRELASPPYGLTGGLKASSFSDFHRYTGTSSSHSLIDFRILSRCFP